MATTTKTYTKSVKLTGYTTCTVTYTVTESETNATIAFTKIAWTNSRTSGLTTAITWRVQTEQIESHIVPHFPELSETGTAAKGKKSWSKTLTGVSASCAKGHSAVTASNSLLIYMNDSSQSWTKTVSITAPTAAQTSYKVTLNANGGTGGTASLTKWHGETLSLTTSFTAPTRTGYRFVGWGTSSSATTTQATYTANAATTLYAVWEKLINGITLDVTTLRVTNGTSTQEDDEGTWCYGTCAYSITGPAAANVTFTVSVTPNTPQIVQDTFTATKTEDNTLSGSFVFRASGCATDASYTFMVEAVAENTSATQTVTKSQGNVLSMAYYVLDVLGDNYVSSGQRPAHGISFGAPCKTEGFHVAMPADFGDGVAITGNLSFGGETMPDFVVEQGTSGIWTYRKWHSGVAECWGTYTASVVISTSSAAYGGYRSGSITAPAYPVAFTAKPTTTALLVSGSQGAWVNNAQDSTATNFKFYLSAGASLAAADRGVSIHAIGRWA